MWTRFAVRAATIAMGQCALLSGAPNGEKLLLVLLVSVLEVVSCRSLGAALSERPTGRCVYARE